jgi:Calcineurin-like phosphoesterase
MKRWSIAILPLLLLALSAQKDDPPDEREVTDGPYVTYSDSRMYVNYIVKDGDTLARKVDSMEIGRRSGYVLKVSTEVPGKTFEVKLKAKLQEERSVWGKPKRALVISDIEGNFMALRKLLVANKVIDEDFNWTFDDGHLLFIGDFVDRGKQQTEVLWLIYSLEDKAKAAGGYVHYVLGNHEIMNLSGDLRYLDPKYFQAAKLMNKHYVEVMGEKSELGRWLRTKNVAEKIGDILYVHGGISPMVYRSRLMFP